MTDEEKRSLLKPNERIDDLQRNQLEIIQNPAGFSFGMDAVLLTGFVRVRPGDRVLDLGTGTGILPILLSAKTAAAQFTGLEIQPESVDMARRSVLLNGLQNRIEIVEGDIREAGVRLTPASYDVVISNPPYIPAGRGPVNPADAKAAARHEIRCSFRDVAGAAGCLLKPGGHFFLVHRPFRLPELLSVLTECGMEPKRMRLVYPRADHASNLVLIESVRGGHPELTVEKPLIIWKEDGTWPDEVRELYGC